MRNHLDRLMMMKEEQISLIVIRGCYHIPKKECPAVLMVWARDQETKEIFGLSCCTMDASNTESHSSAVHYHQIVRHRKSYTLQPIHFGVSCQSMFCGRALGRILHGNRQSCDFNVFKMSVFVCGMCC